MSADPGEVTMLLHRLAGGDDDARERLYPLVYDELRAIAGRFLRAERAHHTLQPTALVHEAYIKLVAREGGEVKGPDGAFDGRDHFVSVAAQAMRFILVDHARARRADKRGGGREAVPLDEVVLGFEQAAGADLLALDEALVDLAELDPELARITELRFFAGVDTTATSRAMGVSKRTVERGWSTARAWLRQRLGD